MSAEKHGHAEKHEDEISPKLKRGLYIGLALLIVADFFVHKHHVVFFWDKIPGFTAVYSFIATVAIVVVAKGIGHAILMKPEDYYE